MFGIYRTVLAFAVMVQHLLGVPAIGGFAVFGFFVLSGFLMTLITNDSYGHDRSGRTRFFANRALRLFPTYWIGCLLSLLLIALLGADTVASQHPAIRTPTDIASILSNATMIFPSLSPLAVTPRLCPPSWALTVEIFYYAAIGLGAAKTPNRAKALALVGVAYVVGTVAFGMGSETRYSYVPAAALPFGVGALLYHYRETSSRIASLIPMNAWACLAIYPFLAVASQAIPGKGVRDLFFYINLLLQAVVVIKLRDASGTKKRRRVDKVIGDLSYPVYILHYQAGLIAAMLLLGAPVSGMSGASLLAFSGAVVVVLGISVVIVTQIDPRIEYFRRYLREAKARRSVAKLPA